MAELKFTQGEWKRRDTETSGLVFCNGWLIADVGATPRKAENKEESALYYKEQVANAHLIASAPDMYEALRECLPTIESTHGKPELVNKIKQVLNKVEDVNGN